ncbi:hypothetical protein IFO70_03185 [Phormidium tenue FACHB-886]|nr:hypothetical protein [Phormidium tenue FACHB-886]
MKWFTFACICSVLAGFSAPSFACPPDRLASLPASAESASIAQAVSDVYETEGTNDGVPFRVRVRELRRVSGDAIQLKVALTNTGSDQLAFTLLNVTPNESIYVVDTQEQTKAEVLRDSSGTALASNEPYFSLNPGETIELSARFPAPPSTTDRLTIYFPHAAAPIEDVPITQ